jgi:hypothetical protein
VLRYFESLDAFRRLFPLVSCGRSGIRCRVLIWPGVEIWEVLLQISVTIRKYASFAGLGKFQEKVRQGYEKLGGSSSAA